jgi:hypothetical protein
MTASQFVWILAVVVVHVRVDSMKIGTKEVEYVGKLAQLAITEEEKSLFIGQLNSILEFVEQLNQPRHLKC